MARSDRLPFVLCRLCKKTKDATALRRGVSRSQLLETHRIFRDATALRRGVSRLVLLLVNFRG
jgi:hypothetical protein